MNWIAGKMGWDGFTMVIWTSRCGELKIDISQTITDLCYTYHLLLDSFFLSRTNLKKGTTQNPSFIASIAYRIYQNVANLLLSSLN